LLGIYWYMKKYFMLLLISFSLNGYGQQLKDTTQLEEVSIITLRKQRDIERLDSIQGTYIYSGKKTEVIKLNSRDAALTEKFGRQIFAKVPGVFVYDMDGTGNQLNISTRGLDPHRGWEFNIRKDGIITNSDMYGYPASHYNMPMEAVDRIELVRGTGSLQYGAQFGGMLNYVSKQPDSTRVIAFESINTVGSFGLVSTFNAISGTLGKFQYSAWYNKKSSDGYRRNSRSKYEAQNVTLYYHPTANLTIKAEWTRSVYNTQLAGALTDAMFEADPKMATRARNYYSPDIHIPSLHLDWKLGTDTRLSFSSSALLGSRNSVMFDKAANIADTINLLTNDYNNRQVDKDRFNSFTSELRLLQSYNLIGLKSSFAGGVQFMDNDLHRRQLGVGTTGFDYDLNLATPGWGRDMYFKTKNLAVFIENKWQLLPRLSINTGIRTEIGKTNMGGIINNYPENDIPNTIKHQFPIIGVNAQYQLNKDIDIYTGWSQAYRPVIFKDIIPASTFELVDKQLKDAKGYNFEGGIRGKAGFLSWDISYFQLQYNNRLGSVAQTNAAGDLTIYKTNIGNSLNKGVELFTEANFPIGAKSNLTLFTATTYMHARYQNASIRSGLTNTVVSGNKVESVPEWQSRNGITLKTLNFSISALYSYTGETFADAINTITPTVNAASGLVPSYGLLDFNGNIRLSKALKLGLNISNVLDKKYFTKRPQFYPGPGIWPSDGRSYSATLTIKI
jgi:Fe(3+) dicitrate transport protein